ISRCPPSMDRPTEVLEVSMAKLELPSRIARDERIGRRLQLGQGAFGLFALSGSAHEACKSEHDDRLVPEAAVGRALRDADHVVDFPVGDCDLPLDGDGYPGHELRRAQALRRRLALNDRGVEHERLVAAARSERVELFGSDPDARETDEVLDDRRVLLPEEPSPADRAAA